MEPSSAQVTESHIDCCVCFRYLVCCPLFCVFFKTTLPVLELKLALLADECSESSVTVVSIVRLTYIIKNVSPILGTLVSPDIFIWTSVEANVSIICGQYMTPLPVRSCPERRSANIRVFAVTISMPSLPRTHTTIHLREAQAATQAQKYSQKRLSTTHGHATGKKNSIITNLIVIEKTELERWAKSHVGFCDRCRDGSKESTSSRIGRRSAGTTYSGNWDIEARIEGGFSKITSRIGGMEQAYPGVGGRAQLCRGTIKSVEVLFCHAGNCRQDLCQVWNDKTNLWSSFQDNMSFATLTCPSLTNSCSGILLESFCLFGNPAS